MEDVLGLRGGGRPADLAYLVLVIGGVCEEEAEGAAGSGPQCVSVTCLRSLRFMIVKGTGADWHQLCVSHWLLPHRVALVFCHSYPVT